MLNIISKESKALILLEFTRQLLMHSSYGEVEELREIINEDTTKQKKLPNINEVNKETIREIIREKEKGIKKIEKQEIFNPNIGKNLGKDFETGTSRIPIRIRPRVLRIPEIRLPERLQYLRPVPHSVEIDLGKLNAFIQDPIVRRIECNGPGENMVVMVPLPQNTNIILNKEEIEDIIKIFVQKSKIPAGEGIYTVVVGKLIFSAIISDVIGSKFSIKKMNYAPIFS